MANNLEYTLRLKDQFSKTMQGASNQVKGLDGKMNGLKSSLGGLKGAIAGAFSIGAVVSFGKAVIESLKNYEYFHASLNTMLKGNEYATKALEAQLVNLAKTTPFELTEVQTATKQLLAYGFKAGDVVQTMRTLGDVSSGIGAPLGDIAYLYGTLKTSGRVTLMDLRQFAGRGIPIYEVLAKRLNTTTAAINGMVSSGKIGFKDVEGAFKDMTKEGGQFFNLMEAQSKTTGGQLSMFSDSWEQIKVNIGKSQSGIIADTVTFMNSLVDLLNQRLVVGNFLDEAKSKANIRTGIMEKIYNTGIFSPQMSGTSVLAGGLKKMGDEGAGSKGDIQKNLKGLYALTIANQKTFEKTGNLEQFKTTASLIDETRKMLLGGLDVLKAKENPTITENGAEGVDGGKTKSLGTGSEVSGQRPQAINININKLVEELNIQTTNLTEGAGRMKELVSKALLEAVNDINLIAMA